LAADVFPGKAILSVTWRRYIRRARGGPVPAARRRKQAVPVRNDGLTLEKLKNYRPSEKEPFMNERQREYFRLKLLAWKDEILRESKLTLQTLQEENVNHPDLADRASSETDRAIELRARDRQRKLISKIDAALQRIEDNTYGYCEETGEPISLKRLEARPIATLSVEAQERHEKREKVYRDE
jgi:DnaK suppressor protein